MISHPTDAELNEYADDELDAHARLLIEAHLASCNACRAEVAAIRSLVAAVGELPRAIAPTHDLRAGIADRIARAQPVETARPRRMFRLPAMFAAAAVLVIATAAVTRWWMLQDISPTPGSMRNDTAAAMPVAYRADETRYLDAIEELQQVLERERGELAPQTIEILESNLAIIDRAIAESRAALARDPANRDLGLMVLSAYEQKLQLLQRARVSAL